jgi:hypothetical protein
MGAARDEVKKKRRAIRRLPQMAQDREDGMKSLAHLPVRRRTA